MPNLDMDMGMAILLEVPKLIFSGFLPRRGRLAGGKRIGKSWNYLYVLCRLSCFTVSHLRLKGKGAFGSVVKARNKIDNRIYAVKKIRLKTQKSDTKIFREVNALSRLSHRFIVRYFTTWVETNEIQNVSSATPSVGGVSSSGIETSFEARTTLPRSRPSLNGDEDADDEDGDGIDVSVSTVSERHLPTNGGGFSIEDFSDFDDRTTTTEISNTSRGSFPSIHFDRSTSPGGSTEEEEEDTEEEEEDSNESGSNSALSSVGPAGTDLGGLFRRDSVTGLITAGLGSESTQGRSLRGEGRRRAGTIVGDRGNTAITTSIMQSGSVATTGVNVIEDGNGVGARTKIPYSLDAISNMNMTRTLYIQMEFVERQTLREVCIHCDFYFMLISYATCRELTKELRKMRHGNYLVRLWMHWYTCRH